MKGRKTSVDQIIRTLREIEVLQGKGLTGGGRGTLGHCGRVN